MKRRAKFTTEQVEAMAGRTHEDAEATGDRKKVSNRRTVILLVWLGAVVVFLAGVGLAHALSRDHLVCAIGIVAALASHDCSTVNDWYTASDVMRLAPLIALAVTLWLYRDRLSRLSGSGLRGSNASSIQLT